MIKSLVAVVDRLLAQDIDLMVDAAVHAEYLELSREHDRLEHRRALLLAALHHRGVPAGAGSSSTPAWVQFTTGQRAGDARASLEAGLACETLPLTAKAWAQGEISASAARTICTGRPEGYTEEYAAVEETLVDFAAAGDWRGMRATIAYAQRCADALSDREPADRNGLHLSKSGDRWILDGDLDDLAGTTVDTAISAAMRPRAADDARSPSKRRADGLVEVCRFFLDHEDLPLEGGEAPHVSLVMSWETARDRLPSATGIGPSLSVAQVSELLCDSKISRIVLGSDRQPVAVGRAQRLATPAQRRALAVRDRGCRFPGCDRRPHRSKAHHVKPWDPDGDTDLDNLVLLCSYHHHLVHRPGWADTFDGTTYTVTRPDGTVDTT